jgi:hypothetical protein
MRDTYLSIDLDYWGGDSESCKHKKNLDNRVAGDSVGCRGCRAGWYGRD